MRFVFSSPGEGACIPVEFDPAKVEWKSQNFGQFVPEGVYFKELGRRLFVKRLRGRPLSYEFLKSHIEKPCSPCAPRVHAVAEDGSGGRGYRHYIFYEQLEGATLDSLKGQLEANNCREILSGVCIALRDINRSGYWHGDLDIKNVFIGKGVSDKIVRLIDIDSCIPLEVKFRDYLNDGGRRPNVNERYWSYLALKCAPEKLMSLSGVQLSKGAFLYFCVDLFFFVGFPGRVMALSPRDIDRIMSSKNNRYFGAGAVSAWESAHDRLLAESGEDVPWKDVYRFAMEAFGFENGRGRPQGFIEGAIQSFKAALFGGNK